MKKLLFIALSCLGATQLSHAADNGFDLMERAVRKYRKLNEEFKKLISENEREIEQVKNEARQLGDLSNKDLVEFRQKEDAINVKYEKAIKIIESLMSRQKSIIGKLKASLY